MLKSKLGRVWLYGIVALLIGILFTFLTGFVIRLDKEQLLSTSVHIAPQPMTAEATQKQVQQVQQQVQQQVDVQVLTSSKNVISSTTGNLSFNTCYSPEVQAYNIRIYELCEESFDVEYGGNKLSPLYPMALSCVEDGSHADYKITFCPLFPSSVIPLTSVDDIDKMDIGVLYSSEDYLKKLWHINSKYKGPLQMAAGYGYSNDIKSKLGISERESMAMYVSSMYSSVSAAYESSNLQAYGDRWRIRDCVQFTANKFRELVPRVERNYGDTCGELTFELLMAVAHNTGESVCGPGNKHILGGVWHSGSTAFNYCVALSSDKFVEIVRAEAIRALSDARVNSSAVVPQLSNTGADALIQEGVQDGCIMPLSTYGCYYQCGKYSGQEKFQYPVKLLYAKIMLEELYSGK